MNQFQIYLLIGAIITAAVSYKLPRSWLWIICGAGSFAASTAYARLGMPYPSAFSVSCDAIVVLAIYHFAKQNYELVLWRIFQSMILINILYLAGLIGPKWAYIVALEIMNWAALFFIAGTAISEKVGRNGVDLGRVGSRYFRATRMALQRERAHAPWHKVQR